jgi:hypothetical protein
MVCAHEKSLLMNRSLVMNESSAQLCPMFSMENITLTFDDLSKSFGGLLCIS